MSTLRITALAIGLSAGMACAAPLTVPFDGSRHAVALDVTVKGTPLFMLLDTGIDPSVIERARVRALGLKFDRTAGGDVSGEGHDAQVKAYPATISNLAIAGRAFAPIDALAADMSGMSQTYGRTLDGVLGYSFLRDKAVLIDYPHHTVSILDGPASLPPGTCAKQFRIPLKFIAGENFPVIPAFQFGDAVAQVSLDTGSSGQISLYRKTLALPGVRAALTPLGKAKSTGARGNSISPTYTLHLAIGFGPFTLPPGQVVRLRDEDGSPDTRMANVGNRIFEAMKLKMLLDYPEHQIVFYGDCR